MLQYQLEAKEEICKGLMPLWITCFKVLGRDRSGHIRKAAWHMEWILQSGEVTTLCTSDNWCTGQRICCHPYHSEGSTMVVTQICKSQCLPIAQTQGSVLNYECPKALNLSMWMRIMQNQCVNTILVVSCLIALCQSVGVIHLWDLSHGTGVQVWGLGMTALLGIWSTS